MEKQLLSVKAIFDEAIEISSPPDRAAYLDRACAGDAQLRQKVEALLKAYRDAGSFLEQPPAALAASIVDTPLSAEGPGTIIGRYKLLEEIAEGGMGVVYMAEQQEPVRRKVALKIIKPGMDSRQVIARFEAERQALAMMDHPNIAKMLDAGETASGRPYFAMELVSGEPITKYCEAHALDTRARLGLMVTVCQAVQHAHQKGIIHRDLKPNNVLVSVQDGAPAVKIIDFGIAKAIGQQLTEGTVFTGFNQLIGTPMYMSPEQAGLSGQDVDTRSDVYSLAVMIYELLTGATPFDEQRLAKAGYDEMRRIIREEEPLKPSTRVMTMGAPTMGTRCPAGSPGAPGLPAPCSLPSAKGLSAQLKGELDWIVMRGLEKDRTRRYESAGALARDSERYLRDEPVSAGPPSAWYRLSKFARRHRGPLALAGIAAAALVVIAIGSLVAAFSLHQALGRAESAEENSRQAAATAINSEKEAERRLYNSLFEQARAARFSRRIGQRFQSLDALDNAVRIARNLGTLAEHRLELRNEAIAAAALPDVRVCKEWDGSPAGAYLDFDDSLERYVWTDKAGLVSVRRVWDDRVLYSFRVPARESWPELSRDGRFLSVRQLTGNLSVWRLSGQKPEQIIHRSDCGRTAAFSPDNQHFAMLDRRQTVEVYDLAAAKRGRPLSVDQPVEHLAFAPPTHSEGAPPWLAISTNRGVQVRNYETGESVAVLEPEVAFGTLAWHPNGDVLAAISDGDRSIFLWDVPANKLLGKLQGIHGTNNGLAFSHAGDLLASNGWEGVLRLWDWRGRQQSFNTHCEYPSCPRFAADDRRLAADRVGSSLRVWEIGDRGEYRTLSRDPSLGPANYQHGLAIDPTGRLLAATLDDGVCFWDLQSGQQAKFVPFQSQPSTASLVFERSGALLTFGNTGLLRWPWKQPADHSVASAAGVQSVSLGPIQKLPMPALHSTMAASANGAVIASPRGPAPAVVWRRDQSPEIEYLSVKGDFRQVAVSPDGRWIALGEFAGNMPGAVVWDASSGRIEKELPVGGRCSVAFSPDKKWLATVPAAGDVHFWSVPSVLSTIGWTEPSSTVASVSLPALNSIAFSPDSAILAVGLKSGAISLVDVPTGRILAQIDDPNQDVPSSLAFSPDGTLLAAASQLSRSMHVWDLASIRRQLDALGLDWDLPPYPVGSNPANRTPLKLEIKP
jgi:eukaryotic-like serine/threonine-protein kinase